MRSNNSSAILEGLHSDKVIVNESNQVIDGDKVYGFFTSAGKGAEFTIKGPLYVGNVAFMDENEDYEAMARTARKNGWVDKKGEVSIPTGTKGKVTGWDKFTGPIVNFNGFELSEYNGDWPDISVEAVDKKKAKSDKKELDILLALTDAMNKELDTKVYTLDKHLRNVVYTMTRGYHTKAKMIEGYNATLDQGLFSVSFNSSDTATTFMKDLEIALGKKGGFYFEKVALNNGDKVLIPGFNFRGFPVTGVIYETRLFKK